MNDLDIIRKISRIRGTLIARGFVILPDCFYYDGEEVECFVSENFRVDVYPSGKTQSTVEYYSRKTIEKYKEYWYNKRPIL